MKREKKRVMVFCDDCKREMEFYGVTEKGEKKYYCGGCRKKILIGVK